VAWRIEQAQALNLMSDEHFTVDGTLLEACAGLKSFKKVEGDRFVERETFKTIIFGPSVNV
jgi:hypothetical protein